MPTALSYARRRVLPRSRPELGWLGVVMLLTCSLFMTSAKFAPVQPVAWLPSSSTFFCRIESRFAVFSLDAQKRMYFQADEESQTAVIIEVARRHGIRLSVAQQEQLAALPFIGLDIKLLPQWLNLSAQQRQHEEPAGIPYSQLPDYVAASQRISQAQFNIPASFELRADQRLPSQQVMG